MKRHPTVGHDWESGFTTFGLPSTGGKSQREHMHMHTEGFLQGDITELLTDLPAPVL